jgi:hypothetical protein
MGHDDDLIGTRSYGTVGKLNDFLFENLPKKYQSPSFENTIHVALLADHLGMSREGVYKWLRADKISTRGAAAICKLSRGRLTRQDFLPFLF